MAEAVLKGDGETADAATAIPPVANVCSISQTRYTITISWIVKAAQARWGRFPSHYIGLPEAGKILPADAQYCLCSIEDAIRRAINDGRVNSRCDEWAKLNEWILYARQFRAARSRTG